ncbi:MAG: Na+/H+ antiporter NhaC family protein [Bacteroidales bacterium]|nr:Na+/H+ antiporter NhaC family protein [Bacteroidales bacterium]
MKDSDNRWYKSKGWALLPLAVFFLLYVLTFVFTGDLYQMPISVAFMIASVVAVLCLKGEKFADRITLYCRGIANETIMMMIVIFVLAGAFAGTAKGMGAVDATVNMMLFILPQETILASIFIAACFISMSMGTSTGTIAALTPIAVGLASQTDVSLAALLGIVVGGSMFGDNLSFISDTTIVATRTQGCKMQDKFKVNVRIVLPVALLILGIYIYQGMGVVDNFHITADQVEWIKVIPYIAVLISAIAGMNVMVVLTLGIVLSGIIGLSTGGFGVWEWLQDMNQGVVHDMGELIIVSLMAGGMFELIRYNGGIDWLITQLTKNIRSKRSAEFSIAGLVSFTNLCTANNTIALVICGPIAKNISDKFGLDGRKVASLLDTFSCFVQGLIPYGAQLLIAANLAQVNATQIIPYLYYPMFIGVAAILSIVFHYPKKYS